MTDYQQPRCPHGWVDVTQCESCAQAAEIDALRQRIAELESAQQWRPIESVPKSEEVLLGAKDGSTTVGCFSAYSNQLTSDTGSAEWATHWMPLPQPPKE